MITTLHGHSFIMIQFPYFFTMFFTLLKFPHRPQVDWRNTMISEVWRLVPEWMRWFLQILCINSCRKYLYFLIWNVSLLLYVDTSGSQHAPFIMKRYFLLQTLRKLSSMLSNLELFFPRVYCMRLSLVSAQSAVMQQVHHQLPFFLKVECILLDVIGRVLYSF